MPEWLQAAAKITDQYALAAYAIAALVAVIGVLKRGTIRGKPFLIVVVVLAVLASASLPLVAKYIEEKGGIYRVTVAVFDLEGNRAKAPKVSTDVPSQSYDIGDSKQIEIALAHVPADRKVTFFASDSTGREGQTSLNLADDRTPSVTVKIAAKPSEVRGNVLDRSGKGVTGARVSIIGEDGSVATGDGGLFIIATRIPTGQPVTLLIEKDGYSPLRQQHLTGSAPATVVLDSSSTIPRRKGH
jgi:hypothetical protein